MIGRIVITSVPRGLGGGDGWQTVLRTQGLSAPIADRLAQLASYPHPFDFGDPRNPRVLFHRIERAGGRTLHVLGSVRDAGSGYSGRSNHLAELLALDPDELRGLPGGPVFAARGFPWLSRWQGEPREVPPAEEPAVPAHDSGDPAESARSIRCEAWEAATGDPGWAGELAKSFFDGRRAVVWVNERVDAAALFAEAARLLPPAVRWQLEFNTCEIEPFPVHWRAVRQDLTVVGPRPSAQDLVLDLDDIFKKGLRCPDHPLARRARGESPGKAASSGASASASGAATTVTAPTAADPDDTALRERLRAISANRQRRSGTAARRVASRVDAPRWNWWAAAAVVIGVPLLCAVVARQVLIGLYPQWRMDFKTEGANELFADLRRPSEDGRSAKSEKKQDGSGGSPERDASPRAQPEATTPPEMPARNHPKTDDEQKTAKKRSTADEQMAIEEFKKNPEEKVSPFRSTGRGSGPLLSVDDQRPTEQDLCAFDAPNLTDPDCEILSFALPRRIRLWMERDDSPASWRVMGRQFDQLASGTGWDSPALMVCRLAVRHRRLRMEWPEKQITTNPELLRALENSLLEVSCRNGQADEKSGRVSRRIRFAGPIDLEAKAACRSIDPLEKKKIRLEPPELAERIREIDPAALRWKFRLTHPNWPDIIIESPMTEVTVNLPETSIPVGCEDVKKESKPPKLENKKGRFQVVVRIRFSPTKSRTEDIGFSVDPTVTGLDDVPLLKKLLDLEFVRSNLFKKGSQESLKRAVFEGLEILKLKNSKNSLYKVLVFNAFVEDPAGLGLAGECHVVGFDGFNRSVQFNERQRDAVMPAGTYNVPLAGGGAKTEVRTPEKAEEERRPYTEMLTKLGELKKKADEFLVSRLKSEAESIAKAIVACVDEKDPPTPWSDFKNATLEILSISAVATAADSEGHPKTRPGEPLEIELIKPRALPAGR